MRCEKQRVCHSSYVGSQEREGEERARGALDGKEGKKEGARRM
jgi:hypothetical protein